MSKQKFIEPDDISRPQFRNAREEILFNRWSTAEQLHGFLMTAPGQRLMELCKEQMEDAKDDMVKVDPHDAKSIQKLHFKYRVAEQVPVLVNRILNEGEIAASELEE